MGAATACGLYYNSCDFDDLSEVHPAAEAAGTVGCFADIFLIAQNES